MLCFELCRRPNAPKARERQSNAQITYDESYNTKRERVHRKLKARMSQKLDKCSASVTLLSRRVALPLLSTTRSIKVYRKL
jgi:hypothetical protein